MKIDLNDVYVISFTEGMYESSRDFDLFVIGKENAMRRFNELIATPPIDDLGGAVLSKAQVRSETIVADRENEIAHKYYTEESGAWVDECPWKDCD